MFLAALNSQAVYVKELDPEQHKAGVFKFEVCLRPDKYLSPENLKVSGLSELFYSDANRLADTFMECPITWNNLSRIGHFCFAEPETNVTTGFNGKCKAKDLNTAITEAGKGSTDNGQKDTTQR